MKNLLIIFTLLFSTVFFSSPSYAEWKKVVEGASGDTYYVDSERIQKHGGFIYFWYIRDYLKPETNGDLSGKEYRQGDCKLFRLKGLSWSFHKEPMGGGTGLVNNDPDKEWKYPPPNSTLEYLLKSVCNR